ncbi:Bidirectional sugar transporter SWEET2 [Morella rubra]|uniref:Bidirectional sugar transporter SWEET2 n=1 Tax=Morella rubra TaxID=262757 RepID=A0A6A1VTY9_9ROSI|nr:Bidirectional sugar transporter SWEET2 [Morella rubra]
MQLESPMRMIGLLAAVFGLIAIVVAGSLQISDTDMRRIFVGLLSAASLISMSASPLCIISLVIRTKSVEFMPFYLSLSTFLMSTCFFMYGLFNDDVFIYVPNGIGTVLGIVQLALYFYYDNRPRQDSAEPLIEA